MPLFQRAVLLRNRAFSLLEGHQRPHQTRDLYLCAGWLCALLSWFSVDLGQRDAAMTQARTAWLCAELADHDGLRAWSRAAQGSVAYWQGDVLEAARLAEDGLVFAGTGTVGVLLASMAATDWAQAGRHDSATTALDRARAQRDSHDESDDIGGILSCGPARQHGFAGSAHLWLGNSDRAVEEFGSALRLFDAAPSDSLYGTEMLVRADMAAANLHLSRVDGAADVMRPVFELPLNKRHAPLVQRLGKVTALLSGPAFRGSPQARDLRDQIDFSAHSLPRSLPV